MERAVGLDGKRAESHARLAQALAELDMGDRAREAMRRAGGELLVAVGHFVGRDFGAAAKAFARLGMEIDAARSLLLNGSAEDARGRYGAVLGREPENAAAWLGFGLARQQLRQFGGAMDAFGKAEKLFRMRGNLDGLAAVSLRRSETLVSTNEVGRSEADLRQVVAMADATGNQYAGALALTRLGALAARDGRFAEARAITERLRIAPLRARSYFDLGLAYQARLRFEDALAAFQASLRIAESERLERTAEAARRGTAEVLAQVRPGAGMRPSD